MEPELLQGAVAVETQDRLKSLWKPLESLLKDEGYELLDLRVEGGRGGQRLVVFVDRAEGVTIDDCARISRLIEPYLEVEDPFVGSYALEVSSPGIERPLRTEEHFRQHVGKRVRIRLREDAARRNYTGLLVEVAEGQVVLEIDGVRHTLSLGDLERANLVWNFEDWKKT